MFKCIPIVRSVQRFTGPVQDANIQLGILSKMCILWYIALRVSRAIRNRRRRVSREVLFSSLGAGRGAASCKGIAARQTTFGPGNQACRARVKTVGGKTRAAAATTTTLSDGEKGRSRGTYYVVPRERVIYYITARVRACRRIKAPLISARTRSTAVTVFITPYLLSCKYVLKS